jgi:hypothetical protein
MAEIKPHPANVPGDYFVEDDCCMTCEVPFHFAPDLFAYYHDTPDGPHCYVKKQPESPAEQDRMFEAIRHAEAGCIMYRGRDRAIQERLVEAGEGPICLNLPPELQHRSDEVQAAQKQHRPGIRGKVSDLLMRMRRGDPA